MTFSAGFQSKKQLNMIFMTNIAWIQVLILSVGDFKNSKFDWSNEEK